MKSMYRQTVYSEVQGAGAGFGLGFSVVDDPVSKRGRLYVPASGTDFSRRELSSVTWTAVNSIQTWLGVDGSRLRMGQ